MDPLILFVVGGVGLAACVILLVLGLNMLREERANKAGAPAANAADHPLEMAAPGSLTAPASLAAGSVSVPEAPTGLEASKPEAARPAAGSNPFAGVTARLSGSAARSNTHEVLRVMRDNLTGRLSLEIAGKRYASLDEVPDGDMRQALLTTVNDLNDFAGAVELPAAGDRPAEAPAARLAVAARAAKPGEAVTATSAEYRPLPPPSMNPFKQMAVLREMAKNPPPPPKSITEQIDDVLQERIIGTPLIHRGLHVKPGPRGDALFEADGQNYSSVDLLPDVEVRDAIKAAIVEWESKR